MISGKTECYAIIGEPIAQALSPIIHNAALNFVKKDAVFLGFDVKTNKLSKAVEGIKSLGIKGFAVTMPHKQNIIPFLDDMDKSAATIQSVNLVVNEDGLLKGYNTDGVGFIRGLDANGISCSNKTVLLIGAGGAARGLAHALCENKINKLYICNLYEDQAYKFIDDLKNKTQITIEFIKFNNKAVSSIINDIDIVINATSLGMKNNPSTHLDLFNWDSIERHIVFADIVHSPLYTSFLKSAKKYGHTIVTGDYMLLYQGIVAYELLFNEKAPEKIMQQALLSWLSKENK